MELTFEQYESIQNYLDGKMSQEEQRSFEMQLENNSGLKEHLQFEEDLRKNLQLKEGGLKNDIILKNGDTSAGKFDDPAYIRSLINKAGMEYDKEAYGKSKNYSIPESENKTLPGKVIGISYKTLLAIAATIVIAIAGIILITTRTPSVPVVNNNDTPLYKKDTNNLVKNKPVDSVNKSKPGIELLASLFKQYFKKDEIPLQKPQYLAVALDDYEKGNYKTLQQINLNNIPVYRGSELDSKQSVLELTNYYQSFTYIDKDPAKAKNKLQWVISNSKNAEIKVKAQWNLSLIYLRENNIEKTIELLNKVEENKVNIKYANRAAELFNKLK